MKKTTVKKEDRRHYSRWGAQACENSLYTRRMRMYVRMRTMTVLLIENPDILSETRGRPRFDRICLAMRESGFGVCSRTVWDDLKRMGIQNSDTHITKTHLKRLAGFKPERPKDGRGRDSGEEDV